MIQSVGHTLTVTFYTCGLQTSPQQWLWPFTNKGCTSHHLDLSCHENLRRFLVQRSGLAERYKMCNCTVPLDHWRKPQTFPSKPTYHTVTYIQRHISDVNRYKWLSSWWAHDCSKHVVRIEINIWEKRIVYQVGYTQGLYRDARSAEHKPQTLYKVVQIWPGLIFFW
jgi:hypothetical protein